jgi:hypothetical protein
MAGSTFAASSTFNMDMVKANEDEPTNQNSNSRPGSNINTNVQVPETNVTVSNPPSISAREKRNTLPPI